MYIYYQVTKFVTHKHHISRLISYTQIVKFPLQFGPQRMLSKDGRQIEERPFVYQPVV